MYIGDKILSGFLIKKGLPDGNNWKKSFCYYITKPNKKLTMGKEKLFPWEFILCM
jgi:hypothetical protein